MRVKVLRLNVNTVISKKFQESIQKPPHTSLMEYVVFGTLLFTLTLFMKFKLRTEWKQKKIFPAIFLFFFRLNPLLWSMSMGWHPHTSPPETFLCERPLNQAVATWTSPPCNQQEVVVDVENGFSTISSIESCGALRGSGLFRCRFLPWPGTWSVCQRWCRRCRHPPGCTARCPGGARWRWCSTIPTKSPRRGRRWGENGQKKLKDTCNKMIDARNRWVVEEEEEKRSRGRLYRDWMMQGWPMATETRWVGFKKKRSWGLELRRMGRKQCAFYLLHNRGAHARAHTHTHLRCTM